MTILDHSVISLLHFRLDVAWAGERDAECVLTAAEIARIRGLRRPGLRWRATHARAHLREVPGRVRGEAPKDVPLTIGGHGKPFCPGGPAFNVSHSEDRLVIALARDGDIGVDIEVIRPMRDLDAVARHVFTPFELRQLSVLGPEARLPAFYRGWTRKEALVKGLGAGLSIPLDRLSVELGEAPGNALIQCTVPGLNLEGWQVLPATCDPGAAAAVAYSSPLRRVLVSDHSRETEI